MSILSVMIFHLVVFSRKLPLFSFSLSSSASSFFLFLLPLSQVHWFDSGIISVHSDKVTATGSLWCPFIKAGWMINIAGFMGIFRWREPWYIDPRFVGFCRIRRNDKHMANNIHLWTLYLCFDQFFDYLQILLWENHELFIIRVIVYCTLSR